MALKILAFIVLGLGAFLIVDFVHISASDQGIEDCDSKQNVIRGGCVIAAVIFSMILALATII